MKFERYSEYKDSGIDWLGDIPSDWEVKRVKDIGTTVLGKMLDSKASKNKIKKKYLKSKNIQWFNIKLKNVEGMYFTNQELKTYRIKKNDLLLSEGGEVGKTAIWKNELKECYIQNSVHKISIFKNENPEYYLYQSSVLGQSNFYQSIVNLVSIRHLTKEKLINILWSNPPCRTQTKIANYLDTQTTKTDKKVALLEQKIQKYQELKQALINETVLRGLDKTTPLKDSGIEWIGNIPQHWSIKRGKDIFFVEKKSHFQASLGNIKDRIKFFTSSQIQNKWIDKAVYYNESLIFGTGGVASIHYCNESFSASTDCYTLCSKNENIKFLYYYFKAIINEINVIGFNGAGLRHLKKDFINLGITYIPLITEQTQIANYLDQKTSKIDAIIKTTQTQITHLTEFRKTLINDAVTGKIKVA